jgi:uncharacterized protein with HEPN domain
MYKDYVQLLRFMMDECIIIETERKKLLKYEDMMSNELLKRGLVKSVENIGEAASKIPFHQRELWKEIDWKHIVGMRQRLAHDYWGINYEIVWDIIQHKLPELKRQLETLLVRLETK